MRVMSQHLPHTVVSPYQWKWATTTTYDYHVFSMFEKVACGLNTNPRPTQPAKNPQPSPLPDAATAAGPPRPSLVIGLGSSTWIEKPDSQCCDRKEPECKRSVICREF
jgi:hypothetical protein